jgi:hypothetical protein
VALFPVAIAAPVFVAGVNPTVTPNVTRPDPLGQTNPLIPMQGAGQVAKPRNDWDLSGVAACVSEAPKPAETTRTGKFCRLTQTRHWRAAVALFVRA